MSWTNAQQKYAKSALGRAARSKYQSSIKGKAARAAYMARRRARLAGKEQIEVKITPVETEKETSKIEKEALNKK